MESQRAQKRFPRQFSALNSLFDFIAAFHSQYDGTDRDAREVELIVEELFTNFVRHNDGDREIAVELEHVDGSIRICIQDENVEEFDLTRVPEPDPAILLEDRRAGGMGILLVRRLAERVTYDYRDRTSTVTVVKRLRGHD